MRHMTPDDYTSMPWANGLGMTMELARVDLPGGAGMLWRLSMATVAQDGPFSRLPGIDRVLTVIDGPGFDLVGAAAGVLRADPLVPVAFPGDIEIAAQGVTAPAVDFNVMVARADLAARVDHVTGGARLSGETVAVFALVAQRATLNGGVVAMGRHDLILLEGEVVVEGAASVLAVQMQRR